MGNPVTAQLVRHDFPGLASMTPYQPSEKTLGGPAIPSIL